ncbi:PREDICTED: clarin-3 [Elephantulus edwardii]|uniref:clarin-3 n=1 Tax=Elephantulus edwardii TaxID=28737 RepID=UPI0003F07E5F|nr:PREDICTED: clarin-3 [Elephantulus edwardii]
MPTRTKILTFLSSFFTSLGSFIVICSILGTQAWIRSTLAISDDISSGNVTLSYGLFRGKGSQQLTQGLEEPDKYFEVLGILSDSSPKILHLVVVLVLVLSLFCALMSSGFTLYNSVSNPYQTFLGPTGVYTWNGLCASFTLLAMFLFVGNTQSNSLSEELTQLLYPTVTRSGATHQYGYSFWLLLLVVLLNIVTIVIVYFYQRARYRRKQEQRKPMEQAPRDGILF